MRHLVPILFLVFSVFSLQEAHAQCSVSDLTSPPIGLFAAETINFSGTGQSEFEAAVGTWESAIAGQGLVSPVSISVGTNPSGSARVVAVSGALTCGGSNALGCTTHESSIDYNGYKWRGKTLIEIVSDPDDMWPSDVQTVFGLDAAFSESETPGDGIVQVSRQSIFTHEVGHYVGASHSSPDFCSTASGTIPTMDGSPLYSAVIDVQTPSNSTYTWLGLQGGGIMEPSISAVQDLAAADSSWVTAHYTAFDPCQAPASACKTLGICPFGTCEGPPARVELFRVFQTPSGFLAKWVSTHFNSRGLFLQGRNSESESWKDISGSSQNLIPYGQAEYAINVPHQNYYQIVEVDIEGKESIVGRTRPMAKDSTELDSLPKSLRDLTKEARVPVLLGAEFLANPSLKASNELVRQRVERGELSAASFNPSGAAQAATGSGYVIYTNTELAPLVQTYVADYWSLYWGVGPVEVVNIDTAFPGTSADDAFAEPFMTALRGDIAARSASGQFGFFHFIGSASNWREIGPRHEEYWVGPEWSAAYNSVIGTTVPVTDPLSWQWRDIIPINTYTDNVGGPDENMAFWAPYYHSDLFYADTVGIDEVPDVVLARWPVASPDELLQFAYKMQVYNSGWSEIPLARKATSYYGVATLLDDQEFNPVGHGATGAMATLYMNEAKAAFPSNVYNDVDVRTTGCEIPCSDPVVESWTRNSSAILGLGAGSGRTNVVELIDVFVTNGIPDWTNPLLIVGASCGAADFMSTPTIIYLDSFPSRMVDIMMQNPYSGSIAYIGPSHATWQVGNGKIAKAVAAEMFNDTRSMAQSWTVAWSSALLTATEREKQTIRGYMFIGDPLSKLIPPPVVTDAPPATAARNYVVPVENSPNPFNPMTTVRFTLPRSGKVTLKIYSVRGELVRSLLDNEERSAGLHEINWKGTDLRGSRVSSGVYFAKLFVDGTPRGQRKLAVVK